MDSERRVSGICLGSIFDVSYCLDPLDRDTVVSLILHTIELTQSVGWGVMTSSAITSLSSPFTREVYGLGPYAAVNDCEGVVNISL